MQRHTKDQPQAGFSLLEMLVVISLLAATAYVATGAYTGFIEDSQEQLVFTEMQEIAAAIRQFKQDTGYYPREGPFDLVSGSACPTITIGSAGINPSGVDSDHFGSPVNFSQLFDEPDICSIHPLEQLEEWNSETGRGWRGPYLTGIRDGYIDVVTGSNPVNTAVTTYATDVLGIADPFTASHVSVTAGDIMDWSRQAGGSQVEKWGRPYLFVQLSSVWSLVSMGPDGDYDDGEEDLSDPDDVDNDNITITFE